MEIKRGPKIINFGVLRRKQRNNYVMSLSPVFTENGPYVKGQYFTINVRGSFNKSCKRLRIGQVLNNSESSVT